MKKFFESLKDFLYDFMDYIMMLGIVVAVVGIIGWRLDILFAKDDPDFQTKDISKETVITEEGVDSNKEDKSNDKEKKKEDEPDKEETKDKDKSKEKDKDKDKDKDKSKENDKTESTNKDKDSKKEIIKIHIPAGSPAQQIGEILEEEGLIESSNEFYKKATSMELEKHLRAGDYEIETGSSLGKIVKIIANRE